MRVITLTRLREFWQLHSDAEGWLTAWYAIARAAQWQSLIDVRQIYGHADPVKVRSGRIVTVFNVCGNKYRMVVAIHYNTGLIYVLMLLTHDEYSKGAWKELL